MGPSLKNLIAKNKVNRITKFLKSPLKNLPTFDLADIVLSLKTEKQG